MSASISTVDRHSIPTVAIIGNDAVLVAAPATPVQLSHACLRRGFTVAVPASWGDELVAAEALRRLTARARGPAVMCVCPFARSRLLAPGPDLEPFLLSLVSPPVATARYLRTVYGEEGVHITYIGGCPSGADPVIDARLTPDAFLADLAEHGIALSEQPLVFESIVPPDRRRWCSLPGGVPSAELLGSDAETRTLIELDRDDVSTNLAQHIIAREHALLDLAPSLGCACSGAIGSAFSRNARMTVTALEPPRALGPVLDPSVVISLDVLDASSTPASQPEKPAPTIAVPDDALLELRLDEMLGTAVKQPVDQELEAELDADLAEVLAAALPDDEPGDSPTVFTEPMVSTEPSAPSASPEGERRDHAASVEAVAFEATAMTTYVIAEIDSGDHDAAPVLEAARVQSVRRRTPTAMPARHPAATIPKATGSNGQALPRAYFVAKRRTPSAGIATVDGAMREDNRAAQSDVAASLSPAPAELDSRSGDAAATTIIPSPPVSAARVLRPDEPSGAHSMLLRPVVPNNAAPHESPAGPEPTGGGSAIARSSAARGPLTILLVAVLLGFAIIVLFTLRP